MNTQQPFDSQQPSNYDPSTRSPVVPQYQFPTNQAIPSVHQPLLSSPDDNNTMINKSTVLDQVKTIQDLRVKLASSQRSSKNLRIFLTICIIGYIVLFSVYYKAVHQDQQKIDQFHQDVQGWMQVQESLISGDSLNNIKWKDSDKDPMKLGYCHFVAETYRAEAKPGIFGSTCTATLESPQRNIAFSVHMLLLKGNEGGIAVRWSGLNQNISYYKFIIKKVNGNGLWTLRKGLPNADHKDLSTGNVSGLFENRGNFIVIAMKTLEDDIYLYVNGNLVKHFLDKNSFGPGTIGLSTGPGATDGSEVMFSDAKIYTPK